MIQEIHHSNRRYIGQPPSPFTMWRILTVVVIQECFLPLPLPRAFCSHPQLWVMAKGANPDDECIDGINSIRTMTRSNCESRYIPCSSIKDDTLYIDTKLMRCIVKMCPCLSTTFSLTMSNNKLCNLTWFRYTELEQRMLPYSILFIVYLMYNDV